MNQKDSDFPLPMIFQSNHDKLNSIMIDNDYIYLSNGRTFKDTTEFRLSAKEGDSFLILCKKIPLTNFLRITHEKNDCPMYLSFFYSNSLGKEIERTILFEQDEDFFTFIAIVQDLLNLKIKEKQQSVAKAISSNLVMTLLTSFVTYFWFTNSLLDQNGGDKLLGKGKHGILINVGLFLGRKITPFGILAIGSILVFVFGYYLIKRFRNPPVNLIYEKY